MPRSNWRKASPDTEVLISLVPAFEGHCRTCNKRIRLVADIWGDVGIATPAPEFTCNCGNRWRIEANVQMLPANTEEESEDEEENTTPTRRSRKRDETENDD